MVEIRRRKFLNSGVTGGFIALAGCAELDEEGDDEESTQEDEEEDDQPVNLDEVVEITEENTGISPISSDDPAPGFHEYEVTNTGDETVDFYVHVAFYDDTGNAVLCNSHYHILPPDESDSEYTNPATEPFVDAEIVDIVAEDEDGYCNQ